jgi:hypothetical protein
MASEKQWDHEVCELTNKLMQCEDDIERLRAGLHLALKDPRFTELSDDPITARHHWPEPRRSNNRAQEHKAESCRKAEPTAHASGTHFCPAFCSGHKILMPLLAVTFAIDQGERYIMYA